MSAVIDLTAAAVTAQSIVVRAPYSQVLISHEEADDHIIMRARQLFAILHVMPIEGYSENMIRLASRLADDLVRAIKGNGNGDGDGPLLASQLSELLLKIQGDGGPCDLLWLCQQIADELDETMSSMITEGGAA